MPECNKNAVVCAILLDGQLCIKYLRCNICKKTYPGGLSQTQFKKHEEQCHFSSPRDSLHTKMRLPCGTKVQVSCLLCCNFASCFDERDFFTHLQRHWDKLQVRITTDGRVLIEYTLNQVVTRTDRRCVCVFCGSVFYFPRKLYRHFTSKGNALESNSVFCERDNYLLLRRIAYHGQRDPLPQDLVHFLSRCTLVHTSDLPHLYLNSAAPKWGNKVMLTWNCFSLGVKSLFTTCHAEIDDDEVCEECERRLGVSLPPGVCLTERQPLVRMSQRDIAHFFNVSTWRTDRQFQRLPPFFAIPQPGLLEMVKHETVSMVL